MLMKDLRERRPPKPRRAVTEMTERQKGTQKRKRFCSGCRVVLAVCLLINLAACTKKQVISGQGLGWAVARKNPPRQVAVLPFADSTQTNGLADLVRAAFYSHLSVLPFNDLELYQVDARLKDHDLSTADRIAQTPVKDLGLILGVDAVVFGEVTEFDRVFAGFYSQLSVGAAITIYDTRSGQRLWADSHVSRFHEGGLPFSIISIPLITMRSGLNLRETVKLRAVDELCRELINRIPSSKSEDIGKKEVYAYEVQAGAFLEEKWAQNLSQQLRQKGFPAAIRQHREGPDLWHRVLIGPYPAQEEAQRVLEKIRTEIKADAYAYRVRLTPK